MKFDILINIGSGEQRGVRARRNSTQPSAESGSGHYDRTPAAGGYFAQVRRTVLDGVLRRVTTSQVRGG